MAINRIISFEFNRVETEVFKKDFSDTYNYLGNFSLDSDPELPKWQHTLPHDILLINVHQDNFRRCSTFLRGYAFKTSVRIFFVTNSYFEALTYLISQYSGAQILFKPLRRNYIKKLFAKNSKPTSTKYLNNTVQHEFMPYLQSLINSSDEDFHRNIHEIAHYLIPVNPAGKKEGQNDIKESQKNCKTFSSLYVCKSGEQLGEKENKQLTDYYYELVKQIENTTDSIVLRDLIINFFKDCYILTHPNFISMDQERIHALKNKIAFYINKGYDFSLEDIAKEMHLSASYLSRLFLKTDNQNYKDYILNLRLEKACQLLQSTNQTIEEIALNCGYKESSSFSRAFKGKYGISPSAFRKKYLENINH